MSRALWYVASAIVGVLLRRLAGVLESDSCPLAPTSFICASWPTIAGAGSGVLAALGFTNARSRLAAIKAARAVKTALTPAPAQPEPETFTDAEGNTYPARVDVAQPTGGYNDDLTPGA